MQIVFDMDFAVLVVTMSTILVAASLTIIAFLLNRDFRRQLRTFEEEHARLARLEGGLLGVTVRIDRNVSRDNASVLILKQLISGVLNAEKFKAFLDAHPDPKSEEYRMAEETRSSFIEGIHRRMWEVDLLTSTRLDKRSQLLSEMVAEPADQELFDFLERAKEFFDDKETRELLETSLILARERSDKS